MIQTRNDHERDLMNGELGSLLHYDEPEDSVTLATDDGRRLAMGTDELGTLRLAYAISVHKAQGSQAPAVVVPVFRGHQMMLTRNLLYTAVTRAERACVLVAQPEALGTALRRRDTRRRHTRLARLVADGGVRSWRGRRRQRHGDGGWLGRDRPRPRGSVPPDRPPAMCLSPAQRA